MPGNHCNVTGLLRCMFDTMSTSMVISCADVLLPVITKMINLSLNSGEFADDWKCGVYVKHGTYPEPTGTCRNQPEPTGTCRNHPEPTRNPPETKIIKIK